MDKDYNKLALEVNDLLAKYELSEYTFESMNLVPQGMPIEDETMVRNSNITVSGTIGNKNSAEEKECRVVRLPNNKIKLDCS